MVEGGRKMEQGTRWGLVDRWVNSPVDQPTRRGGSGLVTLARLEESVTQSIDYADGRWSATNALHFQSDLLAHVGLGSERMWRTTSYVTEKGGSSLEREGDLE